MNSDGIPQANIFNALSTEDAGWGDAKRNLKCPECGHEYNHLEPPYLKDGGDNYEAKWGGRGDLIVVPVEGECGSIWQVCFGFHKGNSVAFTRTIKSCKPK